MKQWGSLLCWRLKEEIDNRKEVGGKLDYTDSCSKAASAFLSSGDLQISVEIFHLFCIRVIFVRSFFHK